MSAQIVWVLTQTDNEAEVSTWVHATEEGATKHMAELQGDLEREIEAPIFCMYAEYWGCWFAKRADDLEGDEIATWTLQNQQVFA